MTTKAENMVCVGMRNERPLPEMRRRYIHTLKPPSTPPPTTIYNPSSVDLSVLSTSNGGNSLMFLFCSFRLSAFLRFWVTKVGSSPPRPFWFMYDYVFGRKLQHFVRSFSFVELRHYIHNIPPWGWGVRGGGCLAPLDNTVWGMCVFKKFDGL